MDLGLAVEGNARTENMKFSRTLLHFSVCLGSLRASRERLNGQNLAAESGLCRQLYRLEPAKAGYPCHKRKHQDDLSLFKNQHYF